MAPGTFGNGAHDCALESLYWVVPRISEHRIIEAFQFCTEKWPYDGVTNTEFAVVLKHLGIENRYFPEKEILGELLARKPVVAVP